ncbi:ribose/xylose/arabinose/galactoside ABC-type transport systems, permease components [Mycolicibacterium smegmatis MKD8]|uniref:Autoinducer 2 import system permease protein LsrC n=2 Tax=Mycolicibacterium smegmatis TaxID=1772 RepID=A0A2U9PIC9_MYCSE|nr:ribose/xylose/arabinose/galactoside ABC-type transport systems, permease components [Mycolicibacterium smegmatis MKD8]
MSVSILLIVAVGELLVMISGNIDISVGSMVGVCAFVAASFAADNPEVSVLVPLALGATLGLALGAVNGVLVVVAGVPSIMATLGTLYVFRGADSLIAGSKQITASTVPESYLQLASARIFGVSVLIWLGIGIALAIGIWLRHTRSRRHLYAVGINDSAAVNAGIHSRRLVFGAFAASSLLCGVAGTLWGARFGTVTADAASGFDFKFWLPWLLAG